MGCANSKVSGNQEGRNFIEMNVEIYFGVELICKFIKMRQKEMTDLQLLLFKTVLFDLLKNRYHGHWFPNEPSRGCGYRCLRINETMDPVIQNAATAVGLPVNYINSLFPLQLTVWIDPYDVSYRIGEDNGSISEYFTLFK